jgi:hypothetical protein
MILDVKGPRQESVLKQKGTLTDYHDVVCPMH